MKFIDDLLKLEILMLCRKVVRQKSHDIFGSGTSSSPFKSMSGVSLELEAIMTYMVG